jgi:precorrin-2 dehydrogenase / sirohydrochlorin ferrochelatase
MIHPVYPVALVVANRSCIVIGSDRTVVDKAARLADAGARVKLVGEIVATEAAGLQKRGVAVLRRPFKVEDLSDEYLAVLSHKTPDALAASVAQRCREKKILLAALDRPALCDVVQMSLFERGRLRIGISTEGASPGLARKIREGLEKSLGSVPLEAFLDDLAALRGRLEKEIPAFDARRDALLAAIDGFEFEAKIKFPSKWTADRGAKS